MIGATGSGKSSSCNTICGQRDKFAVSSGLDGHTYETKGILTPWFGKGDEEIFIIDTPGLGDPKGRDTKHIAEMITAL